MTENEAKTKWCPFFQITGSVKQHYDLFQGLALKKLWDHLGTPEDKPRVLK